MKIVIEVNENATNYERANWPVYAVTLRECFQDLLHSVQYHEQPYKGEVRKLYNSGGCCVGELTVTDSGNSEGGTNT